MRLTRRQINALNRSGRAEYDAKLGCLLGEALNKGIGSIIVEADGSVAINDAAEGIPFENIRIIGDGSANDIFDFVVTDGEASQVVYINTGEIVLDNVDGVYDELNLGLGMFIKRTDEGSVLEKEEMYPLPDDAIKAYKELKPYTENMTITSGATPIIVSYVADTKKYIDKKVAELQAIILES